MNLSSIHAKSICSLSLEVDHSSDELKMLHLSKLANFHGAVFLAREGRSTEVIQQGIALKREIRVETVYTSHFFTFCSHCYICSALMEWGEVQ